MEELGYDPRTLVFSIRKKGVPEPEAEVPDDLRKRLEDAQVAAREARRAVEAGDESKGVYVFSEGEHDELRDAVMKAEAAIARALDLLK